MYQCRTICRSHRQLTLARSATCYRISGSAPAVRGWAITFAVPLAMSRIGVPFLHQPMMAPGLIEGWVSCMRDPQGSRGCLHQAASQ